MKRCSYKQKKAKAKDYSNQTKAYTVIGPLRSCQDGPRKAGAVVVPSRAPNKRSTFQALFEVCMNSRVKYR